MAFGRPERNGRFRMAEQRGLVLVNTGRGKGKTTAALGAALRAVGQGWRVLMIQFIKANTDTGEYRAAGSLDGLEIRTLGLGLIRQGADLEPHRAKAREAWEKARAEALSGRWDMLILDEIMAAMGRGFLEPAELASLIRERPADLVLILTGRNCPPEIADLADTVTDMRMVKHHAAAGRMAAPGVEY